MKKDSSLTWLVFALIFGPILMSVLAALIASTLGCELHEGGPQKCMFLGVDIGDDLAGMAMSFWMVFITFPLCIVMLLIEGGKNSLKKRKNESNKKAN